MLRRLHPEQPESFAFTEANQKWAEAQLTKFPEGRQASAIIPLLWRAQEQEGWLSRAAIEHVADMLGLAHIRALEVATFYFMFHLSPVGSVAHVQVCGTTSCMICGAEDLMAVCREKIAPQPHMRSEDGKFSWEEVECLGACSNAPMAQIGKDYYEDLTAERFGEILDELAAGRVPMPGSQTGRYASEPADGLTSLKEYEAGRAEHNASVELALELGDTIKRIDGTEVPLLTPWQRNTTTDAEVEASAAAARSPRPAEGVPADKTGIDKREAPAETKSKPEYSGGQAHNADAKPAEADAAAGSAPKVSDEPMEEGAKGPKQPADEKAADDADAATRAAASVRPEDARKPEALDAPREGKADDLKKIKGVGPKLEALLHGLGFYHFDQIAAWTAEEIAWVDANLEGFKGRVTRDEWVKQAKLLASGQETEFSKRAKY
ncbi:NADH-quinone oxidoreductase subunit E [Psychromarinibacter sp. C21-152]|uniref:NADH-quinone oxidoreductase subunit E n=1 Tax=Psychromarinibacter sediminicola TaxID=3033385 RepID=A0AAE3NMX3_9RHOB|nr:NADH-quinone oxidoreductase subunit E [Psychromarinibacter sediminicola]MDF0599224.1 NADH-quinone oxidoreductase subunit E [Psychromarinibacter sediminicola]